MKINFAGMCLILGAVVVMGVSIPSHAVVIYPDNHIAENGGVGALIGNGYLDFYSGDALYVDFDGSTKNIVGITPEIIQIIPPPEPPLPLPTLTFNTSSTSYENKVFAVLDAPAVDPDTMGPADGTGSVLPVLDQDTLNSVVPVPEPSTMLLLGCGLVGLFGYGRKRMRK